MMLWLKDWLQYMQLNYAAAGPDSQQFLRGSIRAQRPRRRFPIIGIILFIGFAVFYVKYVTQGSKFMAMSIQKIEDNHTVLIPENKRFIIETEGCSILKMKPFDVTVKIFTRKILPNDLEWGCPIHPLLARTRFHIWIIEENKPLYNITDDNYNCCFQPFYRPDSTNNVYAENVDDRTKFGMCINFTTRITSFHEQAIVKCYSKEIEVYRTSFLFAPKKPALYQSDILKRYLTYEYNILVLGIDSVSRLSFQRTMPKTLSFLQHKGAVELLGYTKVGYNTFPNLAALLTGYNSSELRRICLPYRHSMFDGCPFIWTRFKTAGFYTAWAEDTSRLKTYNFLRSPTDYYMHTYMHQAEKISFRYICTREKYFFDILLDYAENILWTLRTFKLFGVFWETALTHNNLNTPTLMDNTYVNFFTHLHQQNYLDNTIVFLMSDHGMRWGRIRLTKQGYLEERLPFVFILTPLTFRKMYPLAFENLKTNAKRLTSPFDIHETLFDLVNVSSLNIESILFRSKGNYAKNRGISLFLPVPKNRTCNMAGIPVEWCACVKPGEVRNTTLAVEAGLHLVEHLNMMLVKYEMCARLKMQEVVTAFEIVSESKAKPSQELGVQIRMNPGDGIFEGTLLFNGQNWIVTSTVSRLTSFLNQSHCIDNIAELKPYCYCIN